MRVAVAGTAPAIGAARAIGAVEAEPLGDLSELYRHLSKPLERIVRVGLRAPEAVLEEACQCAWSRLVRHQHRIDRGTALAWLVKTAAREAHLMIRRGCRELSLDAVVEQGVDFPSPPALGGPDVLAQQHDQLANLSVLPTRQQRVLWLRALGLSYEEIALHDRCTPRTVERQIQRARAQLRALSVD